MKALFLIVSAMLAVAVSPVAAERPAAPACCDCCSVGACECDGCACCDCDTCPNCD